MVLSSSPMATLTPAARNGTTGVMPLRMWKLQLGWLVTETFRRPISPIVLKTAVQRAKLGQSEELAAIKRLDEQARRLERHTSGPSVETLVADERAGPHQH